MCQIHNILKNNKMFFVKFNFIIYRRCNPGHYTHYNEGSVFFCLRIGSSIGHYPFNVVKFRNQRPFS